MIKKLLQLLGFGKQSTPDTKAATKKASPKKPKIEPGRIGELGEHKINIQLDQLPKECRYLSDLMIRNPKSRTGYAQIDHVVISPYGLFVIETKNYNGEIKGGRTDRYWSVSKRFKLYNPLLQNYGHIKALEGVLKQHADVLYISMVSFTMRCRFAIDPELRKIESHELIVYDVELSEFISRKLNRLRATVGAPTLSTTDIDLIYQSLQEANITDPATRAAHVAALKKT